MAEQFANNASTTLNGALTDSATSVTVTDASAFPASGTFRILVESEIMLVTSVAGNTFTVTRGSESTTAVAHADAADVLHVLTAGALSQLKTDASSGSGIGSATGTTGARPAAGNNGDIYFGEDYIARDDGAAWSLWGPAFQMQPPTGTFAWGRQNIATVATHGAGFLAMLVGTSGSEDLETYVKSAPSAPYTLVAGFSALVGGALSGVGICVRDSVDGEVDTIMLENNSSSDAPFVRVKNWATETASATTGFGQQISINSPLTYFKIENDSTNLVFSLSLDGFNWIQLHSKAIGTNAADEIGICGYSSSSFALGAPGATLTVYYWDES